MAKKDAADLAPLVDELGEIDKKLATVRSDIAREKKLKETLRAAVSLRPANESIEIKGKQHVATLGPRGFQTIVDAVKVLKAVGSKLFPALVTVTTKALTDAKVDPAIVASCSATDQTGHRELTVRPL
jgi:hypothetical protein